MILNLKYHLKPTVDSAIWENWFNFSVEITTLLHGLRLFQSLFQYHSHKLLSLTPTPITQNCFQRNCPCVSKKVILAWCVGTNWRTQRQGSFPLLLLDLKNDTLIMCNDSSNSKNTLRSYKNWFYLSQLLKGKRRSERVFFVHFAANGEIHGQNGILDTNLVKLGYILFIIYWSHRSSLTDPVLLIYSYYTFFYIMTLLKTQHIFRCWKLPFPW